MSIGEVLRAVRVARHLTQTQLAVRLFCSEKQVRRWEHGADCRLSLLDAVANVLEVSPAHLVAWRTLPNEVAVMNAVLESSHGRILEGR